MNPKPYPTDERPASSPAARLLFAALLAHTASQTFAATIIKADNTTDLNTASSWVGGVAPTAIDLASWNSTVTGSNSVLLGADTALNGLVVSNPGGAVTIGAGNTLTLGSGGIDMSAATQDLTISSGLTLTQGEIWNIASGRTLTLDTGTFTRTAGTTLNLQGTGTVSAATFPANVNSITGAWATVGTGTSLSYATKNGSNQIVALAGTAVNLGSNGNGGGTNTASGNFNVTGSAILTGGRVANTIRFVDTTALAYNIANRSLTVNGLMNAGAATWTVSGTSGVITTATAVTQELTLSTNTQAFNVSAIVGNNANGAVGVTTSSPDGGTITLSGASTFTGDVNINSGTLLANRVNNTTNPVTSALGNVQVARNINVNGGTLKFGLGDTFGGATTNVAATLVINRGATVTNNGNNFTTLGAINLNGGTLTNTGGATASYQAYNLRGTVTVGGNTASTISGSGTNAGYHLATQTTFNVADATGSAATDLLISGILIDQDGTNLGAGGLLKTGLGTLTLSGANTYTGTTTITAGTLALGANDVFTNTSPIKLNGGTLAAATFTDTLGTLDLDANSSITLGNGGAFIFADSSSLSAGWGSFTLSISGTFTNASSIRFGTTSGGLTSAQLALINVNGQAVTIDTNGYLSAVPEPSAFAALAGLGMLGFAATRRRRN